MSNYQRIVIKVGSNVLTNSDGSLNELQIIDLVKQVVALRAKNIEVILVSSGAVAAGRSQAKLSKKTGIVGAKQVWAALGQVKLISTYTQLFLEHEINCAQVLTTKDNFSDRRHYLNMQNCISSMLENGIIPIVNENDTIAVMELMFTDNDELSGLIASMMNCQALFILSNVDGVYSGNPNDEGTQLIPLIDEKTKNLESFISPVKSGFGRGGMITKCNIARKISKQGIDVYIANGTNKCIVNHIIEGKEVRFTRFKAAKQKPKSVKKWLAHSDTFAKGTVIINKGAEEALLSKNANSLLFIGVIEVLGYFEVGDIVKIQNQNNITIGVGRAQFNSVMANQIKGEKQSKPFIHYDYLNMV